MDSIVSSLKGDMVEPGQPTRNLALELVRVTEAAALASGRFMGRGDKEAADGAAVNAMRLVLQSVDVDGIIVIGEGEKDNAPMLYNGERVGNGSSPEVDVAVDPIDGTRPLAFGRTGSVATVATELLRPKASGRVPSIGSTATSTSGAEPLPTCSPL